MKIVQIGILIALIAVGVLLFMVWKGQQPQTAEVTQPEQAQAPEQAAPAPVEPAPASGEPALAPRSSKPSSRPSPGRASKPAAQAPGRAPASTPAPVATTEPAPAAPAASRPEPEPKTVAAPPPPRKVTLEADTLIPARLSETLDSSKMQPGDTFQATLDKPLVIEGLVIAERGARLTGKVVEAQQAGRVKGTAAIGVELVQLTTSDGQRVNLQTGAFRKEAEKTTKKDAAKIGLGAGIGAAIGAIAGGGKGAAIGAGVGGAAGTGAVMTTRGDAAVIPVETRIDFRLSAPVTITEKR